MRTSKIIVGAVIAMTSVGASALPAHAIAQLDFGLVAPTGGVISFSGVTGDPLIGTDIEVDNVVGLDTPANSGSPITISNGRLNFSTGGSLTQPGDAMWMFAAGGHIAITGAVPAAGILDDTTVLLSGGFEIAQVIPVGLTFHVAVAEFLDIKDPTLAEFFGLSGGHGATFRGNMNLSFLAFGSTAASRLDDGFESFILYSGGIVNTPPAMVPTPASTWMGVGMLGLVALIGVRRLRSASWQLDVAA